jgi:hypothetical protein
VYKSKLSFLLFFSIVLFAAAARLQWGGLRWGDFREGVRIESRADIASLKDDGRFVRREMKLVPVNLRMFWLDLRADMLSLKADAAFESKLARERLSPAAQSR